MELGELFRGEEIKFLQLMNDNLSREIKFLHDQIDLKDDLNEKLLRKLGITERLKVELSDKNWVPVGGYVSLKDKIKDKETASLLEFNKLKDQENAG